jgi:hypothetical protein
VSRVCAAPNDQGAGGEDQQRLREGQGRIAQDH